MAHREQDQLLWQGRSRFTGQAIAAVLTGLDTRSTNRKTGPMAQVWIIPVLLAPMAAVRAGYDTAVCGMCALRPLLKRMARRMVATITQTKPCYVDVTKAPLAVWRRLTRGGYPPGQGGTFRRPVRIGAWGDGAALPLTVVRALSARCAQGWTAYTSHWHRRPGLRPFFMASVKSLAEAETAWRRGWRTFRVLAPDEAPKPWEIHCPAGEEGGKRTTCAACLLCNGLAGKVLTQTTLTHLMRQYHRRPIDAHWRSLVDPRKSIVIHAHGGGKRPPRSTHV